MTKDVLLVQGDARHLPLADESVDLVMGSPPYIDARLYLEGGKNLGISRNLDAWIEWMLDVTTEACRVSRGLVLLVCAGVTRDRIYQPGPEGLLYEWVKRGGVAWRPCYWHRVGIPGSGGKQWLRADVEYVLAFKRTTEWLAWSDNTANGHPPKWAPGGEMSNRTTSGARVNAQCHAKEGEWCGVRGCPNCDPWVKHGRGNGVGDRNDDGSIKLGTNLSRMTPWGPRPSRAGKRPDGSPNGNCFNGMGKVVRKSKSRQHTKSRADGTDEIQIYEAPVLANPGTLLNGDEDGPGAYIPEDCDYIEPLVSTKVGGGHLGHPDCHENEAPYPVALCEWFIKHLVPPGGTVCDPFSGSGTTVDAAWRLGRKGIGVDLRQSQVELGRRRMKNPMAKKPSKKRVNGEVTLFGAA